MEESFHMNNAVSLLKVSDNSARSLGLDGKALYPKREQSAPTLRPTRNELLS
jgi:hypothetical protein